MALAALMERRSLELLVRRADAEERLLERRLAQVADDQTMARRQIEAELRREHWGRLP
jgi:hypothetical protein